LSVLFSKTYKNDEYLIDLFVLNISYIEFVKSKIVIRLNKRRSARREKGIKKPTFPG
jgi:hypothetical protein